MGKRRGRPARRFRAVFGSSFSPVAFRRRLSVELLGSHLDCLGDVSAIVVGVSSAGDALFLDPSVVCLDGYFGERLGIHAVETDFGERAASGVPVGEFEAK